MCKYCDPSESVDDLGELLVDESTIDIGVMGKIGIQVYIRSGTVEVYVDKTENSKMIKKNITMLNYCPMCGREMKWE